AQRKRGIPCGVFSTRKSPPRLLGPAKTASLAWPAATPRIPFNNKRLNQPPEPHNLLAIQCESWSWSGSVGIWLRSRATGSQRITGTPRQHHYKHYDTYRELHISSNKLIFCVFRAGENYMRI